MQKNKFEMKHLCKVFGRGKPEWFTILTYWNSLFVFLELIRGIAGKKESIKLYIEVSIKVWKEFQVFKKVSFEPKESFELAESTDKISFKIWEFINFVVAFIKGFATAIAKVPEKHFQKCKFLNLRCYHGTEMKFPLWRLWD